MKFKASWAAVTGSAHQQMGIPCQDSVYVCKGAGVICVALADGAGSRSMSHLGSAAVTETVCKLLCQEFSDLYTAEDHVVAQRILTCCLERLNRLPHPLWELASTLLFFASDDQGHFLSGHLGDGVQIMVQQGDARVFSIPDNGETPGVTWFVTSPDALNHFRIERGQLPEHGEILLMSDGMAAGLYQYDTQEPAPACVTVSRWLREEEETVINEALKENMQILFSHKSSDDLSLTIISW